MSQIESIAADIARCRRCALCQIRTRTVPGNGMPNPIIVFIGEAPGENEDKEGKPFVGRSGQFLKKMLRETGGNPRWCFITNTIKCRPPDNRAPEDAESQACWHWLDLQLKTLDPKILVCVGRIAAMQILKPKRTASMKSLIGKWHTSTITGRPIATRVIYHPSFLLQHGRAEEQTTRDDLVELWKTAQEFVEESA